jgi:hypothetical protein
MAKALWLFSLSAAVTLAGTPDKAVTYNRDVAPIMQQHCQECHRAGEIAPMSLMSYKEVRPYAAAIKEAVALRKMPPWFADPHYGHFANDRGLSQGDTDTLVKWVNSGAPEGDAADLPAPRKFLKGWNIEKPDVVLQMPGEFSVPASGTIAYQYYLIPTHFERDTWVRMAEVRPGNHAVLHHVIAYVRPPGSKWLAGIKPGVAYVPQSKEEGDMREAEFLVGYAPGLPPTELPEGRAKLIRAGSDIIFEMHYTANGHTATDRTTIGLKTVDASSVKERVLTMLAANGGFEIPPGDPNYKVEADFRFGSDARIVALLPHMHLRGKDFEYVAKYPSGEAQTLLKVPRYSFSWQLAYVPTGDIVVPKDTVIHCTAHFDNSANNPYNPDPTKKITWGQQSWDEMMIGFFDVAFDKNMSADKLYAPEEKKKDEEPAKTAAASEAKPALN